MQNLNSDAAGTNVNECGRKTLVFPVGWKPWTDSPLPGGTGGWLELVCVVSETSKRKIGQKIISSNTYLIPENILVSH